MDAPQKSFYTIDAPVLMANIRNAMSRRDHFNPTLELYANDTNIFEVMAILEALTIYGEVLA